MSKENETCGAIGPKANTSKSIKLSITIAITISMIPSSFAWDGVVEMDADKRNIERGQIITYQGYLYGDELIEGKVVLITVFEKETKNVILKAETTQDQKRVELRDEITAQPFTFQIGTSYKGFTGNTAYVVEAQYDDKSRELEFFIQADSKSSCLETLEDKPIIVFTDREKYDRGDIIGITGCLSKDASTEEINIAVYDPKGEVIGTSSLILKPDRTFSEEFIINENFGLNGTYTVEVDAGGIYSTTKSFVVPEFGSFALIVLGISLGVILYNKKLFKPITNFS